MKRLLALLCCALLILSLALPIGADFGDFGGDSDYGGDYDYGGSDWDYDYDSSGSYDSDGSGLSLPGAIVLLGIFVAIYFFSSRSKNKNHGGTTGTSNPGATPVAASALTPMQEYLRLDPGFNEAEFREKLSNLYVQMQNGWTAKDIESLRPYFTDAFFSQMERQLRQKINAHQTNYVERISVLGVNLKGFRQANGQDHIIAELRTRIVDYTLDDNTGKLISGSRTAEKFMTYEWDLCRATGETTAAGGTTRKIVCPSCGAPLEVNASARCPYCDSVIQAQASDWALCSIKGISQRTNG